MVEVPDKTAVSDANAAATLIMRRYAKDMKGLAASNNIEARTVNVYELFLELAPTLLYWNRLFFACSLYNYNKLIKLSHYD